MTLKLNQRFETNDEFVGVFNIESKKIFDIWTEFDCKKATVRHLYLCQIQVHLSVNQGPPIFPTGNQEPSIFPDFPEK